MRFTFCGLDKMESAQINTIFSRDGEKDMRVRLSTYQWSKLHDLLERGGYMVTDGGDYFPCHLENSYLVVEDVGERARFWAF